MVLDVKLNHLSKTKSNTYLAKITFIIHLIIFLDVGLLASVSTSSIVHYYYRVQILGIHCKIVENLSPNLPNLLNKQDTPRIL